MEVQEGATSVSSPHVPNEIRDAAGKEGGGGPVSRLYLFLSRCFSYPTEEFHVAVSGTEAPRELELLLAGVPFDVVFAGMGAPVLPWADFESHYINTFDLAPSCPLYESAYAREDMAARDIYEDVVRFYGHFGVKLSQMEKDYHDHLAAELEFMAFLAQKESEAPRRGNDPRPYRLAQRDFLERHLKRWIPLLCARLRKKVKEEPFHQEVGGLLLSLVDSHYAFIKEAA